MFKNHPKIDVKPTERDHKIILAGWLLVALNFVIVFAFYFELPETIATHFDLRGKPNSYSSKDTIWIIPILNLFIYFVMTQLVKKIKPWNYNYPTEVTEENAPKLYRMAIEMIVWLNLGIAFMFLVISLEMILKAIKYEGFTLGWSFIPLIASVTLFPLWYIYKMVKVPK